MDTPKSNSPRIFILLMLLLTALILWAIVLLKSKSDASSPLVIEEKRDRAIVVPDTSIDLQTLPLVADTTTSIVPEEVSRDTRTPYEAGYEDGYLAGIDDGAAHEDYTQYDEDSSFPTPSERETYSKGYRDGYAKGLADGKHGKQFGIGESPKELPATTDETSTSSPSAPSATTEESL